MKQLLTFLLLLPWGLQAQETCDTDYRSPRIHYYVSCPDGSDTRRQADPGQAVRTGSDIWILLLLDGGNAVLAKHAGKTSTTASANGRAHTARSPAGRPSKC